MMLVISDGFSFFNLIGARLNSILAQLKRSTYRTRGIGKVISLRTLHQVGAASAKI